MIECRFESRNGNVWAISIDGNSHLLIASGISEPFADRLADILNLTIKYLRN